MESVARNCLVAVPDLHFPFHHAKALDEAIDIIVDAKPTGVIQLGDLYDFFSWSRFPKKPGVIHPNDELDEGRAQAVDFWKRVRKAAPRADLFQLMGNHCVRPLKIAAERCPELYELVSRSWKPLFQFDGVTTILDGRDDLELNGVVFEHGFFGQPGKHIAENRLPTVIAHTHRPWIHYEQIRGALLWELNCGYLADPSHPALNYPRKRWVKWVHGVGIVENGVPRFQPIRIGNGAR